MDYSALIGMLMSAGGGMAGQAQSATDRYQARLMLQKLISQYDTMKTPSFQDVDAATVGPSGMNNISEDPAAGQAYAESDNALKQIAANGGMDLGDQAALQGVQNRLNAQNSAQNQAILADASRRGQVGSGAQLAMAMHGQQQSAQMASDQGMQVAGDARRRALQALIDRGSQSQSRSNELYRRQAATAQANDLIARNNANARRDAGLYGNEMRQNNFNNQNAIARGRAGVTDSAVGWYGNEANRVQQQYARTGDALGKGASSFLDEDAVRDPKTRYQY